MNAIKMLSSLCGCPFVQKYFIRYIFIRTPPLLAQPLQSIPIFGESLCFKFCTNANVSTWCLKMRHYEYTMRLNSFIPKLPHYLNRRRLRFTLTCMNEQIGESAGCQVGLNCNNGLTEHAICTTCRRLRPSMLTIHYCYSCYS